MTLSRKRASTNRIVALTEKEAAALRDLVTGLYGFVPDKHPVNKAADKLDEQITAQSRDPYDEARDELREWFEHDDPLLFEQAAKAVVDRVLGIYE